MPKVTKAEVTLGRTEIRFRDCVSLRLVFDNGSEGHATGFERDMPLLDIATRVAPFRPAVLC